MRGGKWDVDSNYAEKKAAEPEDGNPLRQCHPKFLKTIPLDVGPVEWIYGRTLIRGMLTVFGGVGGTGKTSYVIKVFLSIALGHSLLAMDPEEQQHVIYEPHGKVWIYSLEDPEDMLVRKVKAELIHHNINPRLVWDRIALRSGRDAPLIVATVVNGEIVRQDIKPFVRFLRDNDIVAASIDPFANSFEGADVENKSDFMKVVLDQWRIIAHEANCAIWLVHHFKKGGLAGDADAFRGSSTIQNNARVMETLSTMTREQAETLGVLDTERSRFVRLENAKANLSAAPAEGQWFRFIGVPLGNRTEKYPAGDVIGVLDRWKPPAEKQLTWQQAETILTRIEEGDPNGMFFTSARQGEYRAGSVICGVAGFTDAHAAKIVKQWMDSKLLTKGESKHPKTGKKAEKLLVNASQRLALITRMKDQP